jgi:outer membrane protein OmpA-like peptidoglycan-associated protein
LRLSKGVTSGKERGTRMTQNNTKKKSARSIIQKIVLIIIGLFLLYLIAGFWVIPPLLKPRLEKEISSQIDRKVTIEEIKLNPLTLSATTTNLAVHEKDGEPFAGFKELLVNAEISSIIKWAVTIKEIRLLSPFGVIKLLPDRTLNISDILTKFSQSEPSPEKEAALPRAILSKLQVEDGKFSMEDLTGAEPIIETISPINVSLANLSTLKGREGTFKFAGDGSNGGKYQLDGRLSVNPIRVQGSYAETGTNLNQLWSHIKDQVSFQIIAGTTTISGNYSVELIDGTLQAKLQDGTFELKDFQLTEKGQEKVLISIPSFSMQGISADVGAREIEVKQVKSTDAGIESWLMPDGTFHLQHLFLADMKNLEEMEKSDTAEPKPADSTPWHATIQKIEVSNWGAVIEDRTLPKPARITIEDLTVSVENLANKKNSKAEVAIALQINQAGTVKVNGNAGIDPLSADLEVLSDKIALKSFQPYVDTAINAQIISGFTSSKGQVLFQVNEGVPQIKLQGGVFELNDFQLTEKGQEKVLISIPSFSMQGISADAEAREIVVEQVKSADARIESWLTPDGTFHLQSLLIPDSQKSKEMEKSGSSESNPPDSSPWQATIHKIEANNWGAAIEDRTLTKPVRITIDDLTVRVENLENKKNSKAKVAIALQINQAGTVKVNGTAGMDPLSADLEVLSDKIALKSFQPYVDSAINAQIISGATSSKGRILYKGKAGQPQIRYQGEFSLDDLEIKDTFETKDFLTQKQFKASGVVLDIHPNKLQVANVLINKPHASVIIDQNGTVNVVQAFTPVPKKGEKKKENLIERLVNFLLLQIKGPMPMKVDLARLKNFSTDFIDESITPPYKTHLEITNGTMKGLSSDPSARAEFKVEGTIDQSATINSVGQMNPLNALKYATVDFSLKHFNLNPVSPYSSKYVGYNIAEGKLNLDLKYRVDDSKFNGDNKIFVDRLILGDKVKSPDATDLPVALGVAILKGGDGNIKLQAPVKGNIKDPKFDFGQIITSALTGAMKDVSALQSPAAADSSSPSTAIDSSTSSATVDSSPSPTSADSSTSSTTEESSISPTVADSSRPSTATDLDDVIGEEVHFIEFEFGNSKLSEDAMRKLAALAKFLNESSALTLNIEGSADQQKDRVKDQAADDDQLKMLALLRANLVKDYLIRKGKVSAKRIQLKPVKIISTGDKEHGRVELYRSAK